MRARNFFDDFERKGCDTYSVPSVVLKPPLLVRPAKGAFAGGARVPTGRLDIVTKCSCKSLRGSHHLVQPSRCSAPLCLVSLSFGGVR